MRISRHRRLARGVAALLIPATCAVCVTPVRAEPIKARLQGLVHGLDGRPAMGIGLRLIDEHGASRGRAETSAAGFYTLDVEAGRYAIVLDAPGSAAAPVVAPKVSLPAGSLVRRDVQLVESDALAVEKRLRGLDASFADWWSGLPTAGKVTFVVGVVVGVGFGIAALGGGDDDEVPASPM